MTAILGCQYDGLPIVISDIAESSRSPVFPAYVPSTGPVYLPPEHVSGSRVSGLIQKTVVFGPTLAIAWCGLVDAARGVMERVRDAHQIRPFTYETLIGLLEGDSPSVKNGEVGLIGLIRDKNDWHLFGMNVDRGTHSRHGVILAGGSGGMPVAEKLGRVVGQLSLAGEDPVNAAVALGSSLVGALITHEVHHRESLRALYGGAYELLTLINGECAKVPEIAYMHWLAAIDGTGVRLQAGQYFRHSYWQDLLLVRTLHFPEGENRDIRDFYMLAPSLFRGLTKSDATVAPIPPLPSPITVHLITFQSVDGQVITTSLVHLQHSRGFEIRQIPLAGGGHKIELEVSDPFRNDVNAAVFARFE